jgi:hypothetical protein
MEWKVGTDMQRTSPPSRLSRVSLRTSFAAIATVVLLASPSAALGAADLTTTVTASPISLPLGGPQTSKVTISATNAGPDSAAAVAVGPVPIPPQLAFSSFSSISQGGAIFSEGAITVSFGAIPAAGTAKVEFVLDDKESGRGTLAASAKTTTEESNLANNATTASIDVLALVPDVSPLAFGSQAVGGIGSPQTLTLVNQAAIPIQVSNVQLAGSDFVTSADGCSGTTVAPGAACAIASRFAPSAAGERTGAMTVASSTAKVAPLSVPLAGTGVAADRQAASLTLTSVPKSIKARKFRKGFQVRITPSEPVALEVELLGTPRKGALASAFELRLFGRSLPLAGGLQRVKVKPVPRLLGPLQKRFKVRLKVVATDAVGNRSSVTRSITVRP